MKYAICLLLLLTQDRAGRSYAAANYALVIDGVFAGWIENVEGGNAAANVITENNGGKKHLGAVKYEDLKFSVRLPFSKPLHDWVDATLRSTFSRKTGMVVLYDHDRKPVEAIEFRAGLIRSITFPTCDASAKSSVEVGITIAVEETKKAAPPQNLNASVDRSKLMTANFRVTLGGLDCSRITKIDPFTVKVNVAEDRGGEARDYAKEPGKLEIPNLKFTLVDNAADWKNWFEDFVVKGNCDDSKEKSGSIEFLSANNRDSLFKIDFGNVGIYRLARVPTDERADQIRRLAAELYCERIQLPAAPAPATDPKEQPPAEKPPAENPPPAAGNTKDEGDRDPKDLPRYENCVRTSFESYREKLYLDERGHYETKDSAKQIEESLNKQLEKLGWELETRNESGEIKKGTNHVHMSYKKGTIYATFDIGPTTEGVTKYTSRYYDDFRLRKK